MNISIATNLKDVASLSEKQVLSNFSTDINKGLSSNEAASRLKKYGLNIIPSHKKSAYGKELIQQP